MNSWWSNLVALLVTANRTQRGEGCLFTEQIRQLFVRMTTAPVTAEMILVKPSGLIIFSRIPRVLTQDLGAETLGLH